MSAEAQVRLQQLWEKLSFHKVKRTVAREPEDVLSIHLNSRELGGHQTYTDYKRIQDVPEEDRDRINVAWRHFYGFTTDNVYFQREDFHGIDYELALTMTWSQYSNKGHQGTFDRPEEGIWIYGEVVNTPRGKRFTKWATCTEAFKLLVEAVRGEITLSEDELGRRLQVDGYPDELFAIARLVLFDNVQAFVDDLKNHERLIEESAPKHPAAGLIYGSYDFTHDDYYMWLTMGSDEYVHLMSYQLQEPAWWHQFLKLAAEQHVPHSHPSLGGWCKACEHELIMAGSLQDSDGFYDLPMPYSSTPWHF